jgi:enamine deaminase RidA (YjgF/YER057c/UK114 family)
VAITLATPLAAQKGGKKKKKKGDEEPPTQQLEVLPDPPSTSSVETTHLGYLLSPLSAKGLLSQQTHEAIRALMRNPHHAHVVKLRAFVAGSGDVRRIQTIVSEEFSAKHQPLPSVSVVQVGALPLEGAQVLIEAAVSEKKALNPHGVAFFSGQQVVADPKPDNPLGPVLPTVEKSLANLLKAAEGVGVGASSMLRVTCLVSSLADYPAISQRAAQVFPGAALSIVQLQRGPLQSVAECEGVGRLPAGEGNDVTLANPPGLTPSPNYSQVALVRSPRMVFSTLQMAFGNSDADARLAFDRLSRLLEAGKTSIKNVFFTQVYPLTNSSLERVRATRFFYLDKTRPPASTMIVFEGLPSLDASFGLEVIAAQN